MYLVWRRLTSVFRQYGAFCHCFVAWVRKIAFFHSFFCFLLNRVRPFLRWMHVIPSRPPGRHSLALANKKNYEGALLR